jgi:hypothetical protein
MGRNSFKSPFEVKFSETFLNEKFVTGHQHFIKRFSGLEETYFAKRVKRRKRQEV